MLALSFSGFPVAVWTVAALEACGSNDTPSPTRRQHERLDKRQQHERFGTPSADAGCTTTPSSTACVDVETAFCERVSECCQAGAGYVANG